MAPQMFIFAVLLLTGLPGALCDWSNLRSGGTGPVRTPGLQCLAMSFAFSFYMSHFERLIDGDNSAVIAQGNNEYDRYMYSVPTLK